MHEEQLELWLVHPSREMSDEFRLAFLNLPGVQVWQERYEYLPPHDCFVTAGNSYGIMTAGIDAAVVRFLGPGVMDSVQQVILSEYCGEQPVGTAFVVETRHPQYPWLVHAPTMRTPGSIEGSDKIYAATWAGLLAIRQHNRQAGWEQQIRTVGSPAMGTGFGGVSYTEAARQMAVAWRHFLEPPTRLDWEVVATRERSICYRGEEKVVRR